MTGSPSAPTTLRDGSPRTAQTISLRDGRTLAFAEFGDPLGRPLFFFHGGGSSRLTRHPDDSITARLGVRLITTDRPGVGLSDFKPGRQLLDWPDDVCELADALGIERFAVCGWSMGGPHALVCAYKIPHRLSAVGVVSGLAPLHWPGPAALSPFGYRLLRLARPSLHRLLTRIPRPFSTTLRTEEILNAPAMVIHRQNLVSLVRAGIRGRALELHIVTRPWGFRLQDIAVPVHLLYGTEDRTTPLYMGQYLGHAIPHAHLSVWPGEDHLLMFRHWREILELLTRSHASDSAQSGG